MILPKQTSSTNYIEDSNQYSPQVKHHHHANSELNHVSDLIKNKKNEMDSFEDISNKHSQHYNLMNKLSYEEQNNSNKFDFNNLDNIPIDDEPTEITESKNTPNYKRVLDTSSSSEENNNYQIKYNDNNANEIENDENIFESPINDKLSNEFKDIIISNNQLDEDMNEYYNEENRLDQIEIRNEVVLTPEEQKVILNT